MTSTREPAKSRVVTHLRRPPVRQSVIVRSDVHHTFGTFVRTIGTWWPVQPFSAGKERVRDIRVEPYEGGRVFETWDDGTVVAWGDVLAWQPPDCLVATLPAPTPPDGPRSWRGLPQVPARYELAAATA